MYWVVNSIMLTGLNFTVQLISCIVYSLMAASTLPKSAGVVPTVTKGITISYGVSSASPVTLVPVPELSVGASSVPEVPFVGFPQAVNIVTAILRTIKIEPIFLSFFIHDIEYI